MPESKSKVKGCLKYGCFGCLGMGALAIGFGATIALVTVNADPERIERQELTQELPTRERRPAQGATTEEEFAAGIAAGEFDVSEPGRVILDLSIGDFDIVPGPPDQPIHVEADFDVSRYKLEQRFEPYGEHGWIYRVTFGNKSFLKMFQIEHGRAPRLKLIIPRDTPITLEGKIKMGESDVELGGLWLVDVDLELGMGDHRVSFREPLLEPLKAFVLKSSMGSMRVSRLGNASPAQVDVRQKMGELRLDLRGNWIRDTRVDVRCQMGECALVVPDGVHIDLKKASILLGEKRIRGLDGLSSPGEGASRMELSVQHTMGELRIDG